MMILSENYSQCSINNIKYKNYVSSKKKLSKYDVLKLSKLRMSKYELKLQKVNICYKIKIQCLSQMTNYAQKYTITT